MRPRRHADSAHLIGLAAGFLTAALPSDLLRPALDTLRQPHCSAGIGRQPGRVGSHDIFEPQLYAVHPQLFRHQIHGGLHREIPLGIPESSHGARRGGIGVNAQSVVHHVGNLVNADVGDAQHGRHIRACTGVRARVQYRVQVQCFQRAVLHGPQLHRDIAGMPGGRRDKIFLAVINQPHGLFRHNGQGRRNGLRLGAGPHMGAERSADVRRVEHPDAAGRKAEQLGQKAP